MKTSSPSVDAAALSRGLDAAAAHAAAGRVAAAAQAYKALERAWPQDVRAAYSLAAIDLQQGRPAPARRRLRAVVGREPGLFAAWHNLGAASQQLNDWTEAAAAYGQAVALRPDAADSRRALATALAILGRIDDAVAQHRALAGDPAARWPALTRIALLDGAAVTDAELAELERGASLADLPIDTRIGLAFALGEALDARGDQDAAFTAFAAGNRLKHAALGPAVAAAATANAAAVDHLCGLVDAAFLSRNAGPAATSAAPIFIVGMPRSGSTLVEQILASHPAVQGLGETGVLPALAAGGYPRSAREVAALAARYLDAMRLRGWDGRSRFVDKTLENYLHVGLIHLMFPRAVILHSVRDPMDTALSCYRQLFASGNETLYDLADIGAEYRRYRRMMAHWSAVLPGRVRDVGYEALVADPQAALPDLVTAAAGLSWDEACRRFYDRKGPVRTASAAQVRRPISTGALGRWRRHAHRLGPLIAALGPDGPGA